MAQHGGTNGKAKKLASRSAAPHAPVEAPRPESRTLQPLDTIGSSPRRTLVFPPSEAYLAVAPAPAMRPASPKPPPTKSAAVKAAHVKSATVKTVAPKPSPNPIGVLTAKWHGEPRPERVHGLRPPPLLDLSLQDHGAAEGGRSHDPAPASSPVVRWTTPNRRPPAPRGVERAARSSERQLPDPGVDDADATVQYPSVTKPAAPKQAKAAPTKAAPTKAAPTKAAPTKAAAKQKPKTSRAPAIPRPVSPPAHLRVPVELLSSAHLLESTRNSRPDERPSERATLPNEMLRAPTADDFVELSASEIRAEVSLTRPPPLPDAHEASPTSSLVPVSSSSPPPAVAIPTPPPPRVGAGQRRWRRAVVPLVVSHVALAVLVMFVGVRKAGPAREPREPRVGVRDRSPLATRVGVPLPSPPSGGCTTTGASRMLAPRAQIGAGLDLTVLETGFGVGLASKATEATAIRVEGSGLRVAETVRVRTPSPVNHVAVDQGRDDEMDGLDLRVDSDDARTVMGGEGPSFRLVARAGSIVALTDERHGSRARALWPIPAAPRGAALGHRPHGGRTSPATDAASLRVAGRDDGGAVVALRRGGMLWLGGVDASLAPAGPLVSIARKGATVGSPAVAPWGGGGVVAWAEKSPGDPDFRVVVAGFSPDGDGTTALGTVREIGRGMSPTIAALPDGDLLLAYADGTSGAHRVLALRLTNQLEARGAALAVSPETVNAGQPVAAVRPDGRALVAFFAADRGKLGSVHATPLVCDPGL